MKKAKETKKRKRDSDDEGGQDEDDEMDVENVVERFNDGTEKKASHLLQTERIAKERTAQGQRVEGLLPSQETQSDRQEARLDRSHSGTL